VAGSVSTVGTLPVVWSNPQSSQNRQFPVRGVPQLGHGTPPAGRDVAGGAETGEAPPDAAETAAGTAIGIVPPIFAPQVSQKSSVVDA
jgi:hypothetical protein